MARILDDGRILAVDTPKGERRFHAAWLLDNALDDHTRSAANGQKLITLRDQPADPRLSTAALKGDEVVVDIDGKPCHFPLSWLIEHGYEEGETQAAGWLAPDGQLWGCELDVQGITADYQQLLADDRCLYEWLTAFSRTGLALVTGFDPADPDAIVRVAERFGYIRPTNYGQVFDVRSELNPSNLAFTGLGLEVHTDNPYRDPVPTIQLLACMVNSAEGGDSVVVDGFAAAKLLQEFDPDAFAILSRYPADFCYAGGDVDLRAQKPIIELSPDGELTCVRFNNRSAAPLTRVPFAELPRFYQAMRAFAEILHEPKLELSFKLSAGELFMVANRRVLHGRKAVVGAGNRWLRGCYADVDSAESKRRVLARKLGATL